MGDDYLNGQNPLFEWVFLSTSPVWGTTKASSATCITRSSFLSTSPVWGTTASAPLLLTRVSMIFLSTSPVWGTTGGTPGRAFGAISFLSTSPVWGTTEISQMQRALERISIHVPRVGDDPRVEAGVFAEHHISIHVPRVGDDQRQRVLHAGGNLFLSTSPVWGTTGTGYELCGTLENFYPRPPCGGRRVLPLACYRNLEFLSTSPVWGTTHAAAV